MGANGTISIDLYLHMTRTLYREARLLDAECYEEWIDLLAEDIRYVMPVPQRRFRTDRAPKRAPAETTIFNDTLDVLKMRITRFRTGLVWTEDPRNAVRHIVSNVEVDPGDQANEVCVRSVIEVHRCRLDGEEKRLTGLRTDTWRNIDEQWKLARRRIELDHPVVLDSNLNLFF